MKRTTRTRKAVDGERSCTFHGCGVIHYSRSLCEKHYRRLIQKGSPTDWRDTFVLKNPPTETEGLIPLTRGLVARVDRRDYDDLILYKWFAFSGGNGTLFYAARSENCKAIFMHHVLCPVPEGKVIDHRDNDTMNNHRDNLRVCTQGQNCRNRRASPGRVKGAYYRKKQDDWTSSINWKGKVRHLGVFDSQEDAATAYDVAAQVLFGEFACLNFPKSKL